MPISFKCASCSAAIKAPDGIEGRRLKCPACKQPVVVPARAVVAKKPGPTTSETTKGKSSSNRYVTALVVAAIVLVLAGVGYVLVAAGLEVGGDAVALAAYPVAVLLAPCVVGMGMGRSRHFGPVVGALLGFFLSWLGVIVIALFPRKRPTKKCPMCAEDVRVKAIVCKHCGHALGGGG